MMLRIYMVLPVFIMLPIVNVLQTLQQYYKVGACIIVYPLTLGKYV